MFCFDITYSYPHNSCLHSLFGVASTKYRNVKVGTTTETMNANAIAQVFLESETDDDIAQMLAQSMADIARNEVDEVKVLGNE